MDIDAIAKDLGDMLSQIDFGEIFTKVLTIAAKAVEGLGKILWMSVFSGDGDLARILFLIIDVTLLTKLFKMLFKALGQKAMTGLVESMGKAKTASSDLTTTLNGTTKATSGLSTGFNNLLTSLGKSVEIIAVFGGIRMVIDGLTGLLTAFAESGLSVGEALSFLAGTLGVITLSFTATCRVDHIVIKNSYNLIFTDTSEIILTVIRNNYNTNHIFMINQNRILNNYE